VRRAGVLLAACCAFGVAIAHAQLVVPRPLPAQPIVVVPGAVTPIPVESWGAIAYHRATGAFGYSFDFIGQREAGAAALETCAHPECIVVASYRNGCGALAEGVTAQEAETKARLQCTDPQCRVIAWSCTK
jgi:Domain of unknown function (DUF4189)